MSDFKIDEVALEQALAKSATGKDPVDVALAELAAQLRPHIPGAQPGDDLEALLRRLIVTSKVEPDSPIADPVERALAVAKALRGYGIYARVIEGDAAVQIERPTGGCQFVPNGVDSELVGPREHARQIRDVIANDARAWAGDR